MPSERSKIASPCPTSSIINSVPDNLGINIKKVTTARDEIIVRNHFHLFVMCNLLPVDLGQKIYSKKQIIKVVAKATKISIVAGMLA